LNALEDAGLARQLPQRALPELAPGENAFSHLSGVDISGGRVFPKCAELPCASLLDDRYCLAHFNTATYEQLYTSVHQFAERPATEESAGQLPVILIPCMEQSSLLREFLPLSTLAWHGLPTFAAPHPIRDVTCVAVRV